MKTQVKVSTFDDNDQEVIWEATAYAGQRPSYFNPKTSPQDEPELYDFMKNGELIEDIPETVEEEMWLKLSEEI